jgi:hypothetical protein
MGTCDRQAYKKVRTTYRRERADFYALKRAGAAPEVLADLRANLAARQSAALQARGLQRAHFFEPFSTKTVSQNQPLETAASKPVETPKSVSGDWLPTPEIARNRANSWVSQDSKWETGLGG